MKLENNRETQANGFVQNQDMYGMNQNPYQDQNTYQYQQNYNNSNNGKTTGFSVKNIIVAIIGIVMNLVLLTGTVLPTQGKKYFVWTYIKDLIDVIKNLKKYDNMFAVRINQYYAIFIYTFIVAAFLAIGIIALVYLIKFIIALCGNKNSVRSMCNEGKSVFMLTLIHMVLIYSARKNFGASGWLYLITALLLIYIAAIMGYAENSQAAGNNRKVYNKQYFINLLILVISTIVPLASASSIIRCSGDAKFGVQIGLYTTITGIPSCIHYKTSFGSLVVIFLIVVLALAVIYLSAKNMMTALTNMYKHYEVGNNVLVRSIFTIVYLIAIEILTIVLSSKYDFHGIKTMPSLLFILGLISSTLIIVLYIIKVIAESTNPENKAEIIPGVRSKLKGKMIADLILLILLSVTLCGIGITLGLISGGEDIKGNNIYGFNSSTTVDSDYDDDYDDDSSDYYDDDYDSEDDDYDSEDDDYDDYDNDDYDYDDEDYFD